MDHRWDEVTSRGRATRREHERFSDRRIARDLDVERRDRLREEERRRSINQSPWSIGLAHYDQRDLYTRNSSTGDDGYGRGPSWHPEEGSYAYHREFHPGVVHLREGDANLYEREAWPWLNYRSTQEDPDFSHLHHERETDRGVWRRLKGGAIELKDRALGAFRGGRGPKNWQRSDERIKEDVSDALAFRGDLDASDIEVSVRNAEVTLEGTVTDRWSKRCAEEVSEAVRGVRDVHNRLTIRREDPTDANVAFVLPLALSGT
jgi:hypothetical protein